MSSVQIRAASSLLSCALLAGLGAPARADTPPSPAGPHAEPPGPPPPAPRPLITVDAQRRAVRGCSVDNDCRDPHDLLREFELEAFPKPGSADPWIDGEDAMGRSAATSNARSRNPLDLRPDLPWLADLELPDLPVVWDHRLIRYLEFYKNDPRGRSIMSAWLRDQGKYRDMILAYLREAGLPEDLLYVCMIESSYDPHEYSRTGASGLWQFMPAAGRIYGLHIDRWLDERNDPERATAAAVLYWKDLYQRFGDWHLALAAYNAGYGNILRSISKYNTNDFWQLLEYESGLPWGSHIYVPKALATAIVGHNRKLFGYDSVAEASPVEFDVVTVPTSVTFEIIARAAGTDAREIARLNPQLRRKRTPPGMAEYAVRIPRGRRALFAERFPQLRGDWDVYDAYVVAHGERFEDIATVHGIGYDELKELNGLDDEADVRGGALLVVPRVSAEDKARNKAVAEDDLYVSGIEGGEPGDPLIVAVPDKDEQRAGKQRVFYRVVAGDSQWQIAHAFGATAAEVAAWNGLAPDAHLHPRMVLQLWVPEGFKAPEKVKLLDPTRILLVTAGSEEHLNLSEGRIGRRRTTYVVKSGGTLEDVGKKYGLSKYDMARINRMPPDTRLNKGDEVIVYEVIDPTKSKRAARQSDALRGKRKKR